MDEPRAMGHLRGQVFIRHSKESKVIILGVLDVSKNIKFKDDNFYLATGYFNDGKSIIKIHHDMSKPYTGATYSTIDDVLLNTRWAIPSDEIGKLTLDEIQAKYFDN